MSKQSDNEFEKENTPSQTTAQKNNPLTPPLGHSVYDKMAIRSTALLLYKSGFAVIPLTPFDLPKGAQFEIVERCEKTGQLKTQKRTCKTPGKAPVHFSFQKRKLLEAEIENTLLKPYKFNIGIVLGYNDLCCIDIDYRNGGACFLDHYGDDFSEYFIREVTKDGLHLYFKSKLIAGNNLVCRIDGNAAPGADCYANKRQMVTAPSVHPDYCDTKGYHKYYIQDYLTLHKDFEELEALPEAAARILFGSKEIDRIIAKSLNKEEDYRDLLYCASRRHDGNFELSGRYAERDFIHWQSIVKKESISNGNRANTLFRLAALGFDFGIKAEHIANYLFAWANEILKKKDRVSAKDVYKQVSCAKKYRQDSVGYRSTELQVEDLYKEGLEILKTLKDSEAVTELLRETSHTKDLNVSGNNNSNVGKESEIKNVNNLATPEPVKKTLKEPSKSSSPSSTLDNRQTQQDSKSDYKELGIPEILYTAENSKVAARQLLQKHFKHTLYKNEIVYWYDPVDRCYTGYNEKDFGWILRHELCKNDHELEKEFTHPDHFINSTFRHFISIVNEKTRGLTLSENIWITRATKDDYFSLQNGILNLRTRELIPHSPDFFCTRKLPFAYDVRAECPLFLSKLDEWFTDVPESHKDGSHDFITCQKHLLQLWFGYVLNKDKEAERFLLMFGKTRSGKGTIESILRNMLGDDSVFDSSFESIINPHGTMGIDDKKVIMFVETSRLSGNMGSSAMQMLKKLSARDKIQVNPKNRTPYSVIPECKPMISCNQLPKAQDAFGAIAARALFLHFKHSFSGKADSTLGKKLKKELPGILNWALEGYRQYKEKLYLHDVKATQGLRKQFEQETQPVSEFVRNCLYVYGINHDEYLLSFLGQAILEEKSDKDLAQEMWTTQHELYAKYKTYCEQYNNGKFLNLRSFISELRNFLSSVEDYPENWTAQRKKVSGKTQAVFLGVQLVDG